MPNQLPPADLKTCPQIVQLCGNHELTRILALTAASPEAPAWPAAAWQSFLAAGDEATNELQRLLLATVEVDLSLSGIVAVTYFEETAELELLLVHPAFRRKGVGRALSRAWLQRARRAQAREAVLEVRESNGAAQTLYAELGFTLDGRRPNYYQHPDEDALLMRRLFAEDPISERPSVDLKLNAPAVAAEGT
ncbi:MAG: GNAT family N-acetyltransferase [Janthinobacterium lividum]